MPAAHENRRELETLRLLVERQARRIEELEARLRDPARASEERVRQERLLVLSKVAAVVSHELRNPLGVIRSSIFYVQKRLLDVDDKVAKHLGRIEQQVVLCNEVIADLLEFTTGRKPYSVPGDVNDWLTSVIEGIKVPQEVRRVVRLADGLPTVPFDPEKMQRVMSDLVDNGVQAVRARLESSSGSSAPSFEPRLEISTEPGPAGVVVTVRDNGTGMDADTLRQAFEPLFTRRARGTGLGLAIAKKIIEEHGGSIRMTSQPGEGTSVTFVLPEVAPAAAMQGAER